MAIVEGWLPPTRENWELILNYWQYGFPIVALLQIPISWYGMGKTSVASSFNIPGRVGWMMMEVPGFTTLLYMMTTLPKQQGIDDLPWQNRVLAGLFVIHYIYRAIIFPLIQPSMSDIHVLVAFMAACFQIFNGTAIGSWLAAYGPVTADEWAKQSSLPQFAIGIAIFYVGLASNFFHDEELREIRRTEERRQARIRAEQGGAEGKSTSVEKHYQIPQAGLFRYALFAHYFCEWVEWFGFLVAAGFGCRPAQAFLVNELFAMMPRAIRGKAWYKEKFGEEKISKKWVAIPGVL